jgi:hypothetical protein
LWIASAGSSHRRDEPNYPYSHSTTSSCARATRNIAVSPDQATPPRSTVWPPQGTHPSTSSRNPSLRRDDIHPNDFGYAPFRNRTQSLRAAAAAAAALTVSSQGSWISSSLGTRPTLSARSYPTQRSGPPSRARSVVEDAIALASDHRAPSAPQAERGTTSPASAAARSQEIEVSTLRILAWLAGVWAPLVCLYCSDYIVLYILLSLSTLGIVFTLPHPPQQHQFTNQRIHIHFPRYKCDHLLAYPSTEFSAAPSHSHPL